MTNKEIPPIFTKVSNNVNDIAMTIAEHIREETTFQHIKGLIEEGLDANFIAKAFKIPVKKVQDII